MALITKDTIIGDLLKEGNVDEIAEVLYGFGMHCLGCIVAHGETVGEAAMVHNIDVDELVKRLNEVAEA